MTRSPFSAGGLCLATSPTLELINKHPINVDVCSYNKPDDDDKIRFGEFVDLKKKKKKN